MADQELGLRLKTDSDVPEAMGKAQKATVSFQKQVEDIQKKFSTAFKDIFLGFTAPMVIIQNVIGYIQDSIAKAKQDAKDGLDLLAQGETIYANEDEKKTAAFFKRKAQIDEERRLVEKGREEMTKQILENQGGQFRDFELPGKYIQQLKGGSATLSSLSKDKDVQRYAQEYFSKTDAGRRILESLGVKDSEPLKPGSFNPQGVNAVVGMGANAALQAQFEQLDEARKQTMLLEQIAQTGGNLPADFTKSNNVAPSRSDTLNR
jgi:uncharacterized protein YjbJ (UPF0337 family)